MINHEDAVAGEIKYNPVTGQWDTSVSAQPAPAEAEPSTGFTPTSPAPFHYISGLSIHDNSMQFTVGNRTYYFMSTGNDGELFFLPPEGGGRVRVGIAADRLAELEAALASRDADRVTAALTTKPVAAPSIDLFSEATDQMLRASRTNPDNWSYRDNFTFTGGPSAGTQGYNDYRLSISETGFVGSGETTQYGIQNGHVIIRGQNQQTGYGMITGTVDEAARARIDQFVQGLLADGYQPEDADRLSRAMDAFVGKLNRSTGDLTLTAAEVEDVLSASPASVPGHTITNVTQR